MKDMEKESRPHPGKRWHIILCVALSIGIYFGVVQGFMAVFHHYFQLTFAGLSLLGAQIFAILLAVGFGVGLYRWLKRPLRTETEV